MCDTAAVAQSTSTLPTIHFNIAEEIVIGRVSGQPSGTTVFGSSSFSKEFREGASAEGIVDDVEDSARPFVIRHELRV